MAWLKVVGCPAKIASGLAMLQNLVCAHVDAHTYTYNLLANICAGGALAIMDAAATVLLSGTCILNDNIAVHSAGAVGMKGGIFRNEGELRMARNMAFAENGGKGGGAFGVYEGGQIEIQNAQLLRNMAATTNDLGSGGDVCSHVSRHVQGGLGAGSN